MKSFCGFALVTILLSSNAWADLNYRGRRTPRELNSRLESLEGDRNSESSEATNHFLSSGDREEDIQHYHSIKHRMGVDFGLMYPFGDFQNEFAMAPNLGVHFIWEAISPFSFTFAYQRSSAAQKTTPNSAKLSINSISVGTAAAFSSKRYIPFVKLEAAFYFNDVAFNDGTRHVSSGNDVNITTVGINAGLGIDFVIGRELSLGLDITYHYPVPKKLSLNNGNTFDLGSPFATAGIRINF